MNIGDKDVDLMIDPSVTIEPGSSLTDTCIMYTKILVQGTLNCSVHFLHFLHILGRIVLREVCKVKLSSVPYRLTVNSSLMVHKDFDRDQTGQFVKPEWNALSEHTPINWQVQSTSPVGPVMYSIGSIK
jgi:hypothetical protein